MLTVALLLVFSHFCVSIKPGPGAQFPTLQQYPVDYASTKHAYTAPSVEVTPGFVSDTNGTLIGLVKLIRHGARYPTKKSISRMHKLKDLFKDLPADHPAVVLNPKFANWQSSFTYGKAGDLHEQVGGMEMQGISQRDAERYGALISQSVSVLSTDAKRTIKSAHIYLDRMFQGATKPNVTIHAEQGDTLMKPFDNCPKFMNETAENKEKTERANARREHHSASILARIHDTLHLNVTSKHLEVISEACAFGNVLNMENERVLCQLFTKDDAVLLDGLNDLDYYEIHGPTNKLGQEMMCEFHRLVLKTFLESKKAPQALLAFNHAETIAHYLNYLAILDVTDEPSPDTWTNPQRAFRTARDIPFSANVALELWKFGSDFRVRAFLNEIPVMVPACASHECSLKDFAFIRSDATSKCDLKQMCRAEAPLVIQQA